MRWALGCIGVVALLFSFWVALLAGAGLVPPLLSVAVGAVAGLIALFGLLLSPPASRLPTTERIEREVRASAP